MKIQCPSCKSINNKDFIKDPIDCEYFLTREKKTIIKKCNDCLCNFQTPMPTISELSQFYKSDYQNYVETSSVGLSKLNKLYQDKLSKNFKNIYGDNCSLLDFGCGQGAFLKCLAENGFTNLMGFDFVEYEENKNIKGVRFISSMEDLQTLKGEFDVIRMQHVIEHLVDHEDIMPLLTSLLKPGGVIIGETPNPAHYTADLWGRYWGPLHFPYHTILFSPKSLKIVCQSWGLEFKNSTGTIVPTGWALSFENWIKRKNNSNHRGRTKWYVFYMMLFTPFALLDKMFNWSQTANFGFVLRKPK